MAFGGNRPSILGGVQTGLALGEAAQRRSLLEQKMKRDEALAQQQATLTKAISDFRNNPNPSAQDVLNLSLVLPEAQQKGLKAGFDALNTERQRDVLGFGGRVLSALNAKQPEIAAELLEQRAVAAENAGNDDEAKQWRVLEDLAARAPEVAFSTLAMQFGALPGGSDVIENIIAVRQERRTQELQPRAIVQAAQQNDLTRAETAKAVADAKKTEAEVAKVNAEAAEVALNAEKLKMQLKKAPIIKLTTGGEKLLNESVTASVNAESLQRQYNDLADQITEDIRGAGVGAQAEEITKRFFGDEDSITRLRQEYRRLRNSAVLDSLPPGVASDRDIQIAMEAFPDDTANPELIASFMRGMAKLQGQEAILNERKAEWVQKIGNLGAPTTDITVTGIEVPSGTTFNEFLRTSATSPVDNTQDELRVF